MPKLLVIGQGTKIQSQKLKRGGGHIDPFLCLLGLKVHKLNKCQRASSDKYSIRKPKQLNFIPIFSVFMIIAAKEYTCGMKIINFFHNWLQSVGKNNSTK